MESPVSELCRSVRRQIETPDIVLCVFLMHQTALFLTNFKKVTQFLSLLSLYQESNIGTFLCIKMRKELKCYACSVLNVSHFFLILYFCLKNTIDNQDIQGSFFFFLVEIKAADFETYWQIINNHNFAVDHRMFEFLQ